MLYNVRIHGRHEQLLICPVTKERAEEQCAQYRLRQQQAPNPPGFVFEVCEHDPRQNRALRERLESEGEEDYSLRDHCADE